MTSRVPLPDVASVKEMIEALSGLEAALSVQQGVDEPEGRDYLARYEFDDGTPAAVSLVSLPIAVVSAAALGLVPQPTAEELRKMERLPENLAPNFRELVNIFAQLMNEDGGPHVKLRDMGQLDELPGGAVTALRRAPSQVAFRVQLEERVGQILFVALGGRPADPRSS